MSSHTPASHDMRIRNILTQGDVGQEVIVRGWVRTRRGSKNVGFVALYDGSCPGTLQIVVPAEASCFETVLPELTTGCSVQVKGELVASQGKGQTVEVIASDIILLGGADAESYPLQKKGHSMEFLRSIAHLRPRTNAFGSVFRIRSTLAQATHRFFEERGFAYVNTPIITASDCEGAGEMFEIKTGGKEAFFGRSANLTVSGQLNAESLAYGLGLVYNFSPCFRAENSHTTRHLSEFWMVEPEMAFYDIHDDMDLAESYLKALVCAAMDRNADDLDFLNRFIDKTLLDTLENAVSAPFERITYTEAIEILKTSSEAFDFPVSWGIDLQTEHERFLAETHFKRPLIITGYPKEIKAFYMYRNDDQRTVAAMDVVVPRIGEIIGGSQREHRMDMLQLAIAEMEADPSHYEWYLELNRYGAVPHAGFGMGFERAVMFCTGMSNIRDVIPFPRSAGQAAF